MWVCLCASYLGTKEMFQNSSFLTGKLYLYKSINKSDDILVAQTEILPVFIIRQTDGLFSSSAVSIFRVKRCC